MHTLLEPSIAVSGNENEVTLEDRRTGLRLRIEQGAASLFHHRRAEGELAQLLVSIGFAGGELSLAELTARQRSYRRWIAGEALERSLASIHVHALRSVPFYRERAEAYALGPPFVAGWSRLPILEKADLRRSFESLIADDAPLRAGMASGELSLVSSSGTTDEAVQSLVVASLLDFPPASFAQWGMGSLGRPPRMVVLTSPSCSIAECRVETSAYAARLEGETTLHLRSSADLFSTADRLIEETAAEVRSFAPDLIYANPIYLHWYLRRAVDLGVRWPECSVVISSFQHLSSFQRAAFERLLGARVVNNYTATELGGIQVAIESRCGHWHVRQDHCSVEVAGDRLIVTTHANRVMPLLRYEIGDVGAIYEADCSCELSHWPSLLLYGRAKDRIQLGGRWRTAREIDEALAPSGGIDLYQVEETALGELTLRVIPPREQQPDLALIEHRLIGLGAEHLRVEVVDRLELAPSLKLRQTFSSQREAP